MQCEKRPDIQELGPNARHPTHDPDNVNEPDVIRKHEQ